jgi:hypothetical protein
MNFYRKNDELNIFMVICDTQSVTFCHDAFEKEKNPTMMDTRVMRKSSYAFDFVMMSSCNSTIISNEIGTLHALMSGGVTIAYKPEPHKEPRFYVPWLVSEKMDNWYSISVQT